MLQLIDVIIKHHLNKLPLKRLGRDWGQCLFTKIIWHEILIEFLQKAIKNIQTILNRIEQQTELTSLIKLFICKRRHEPFMLINIA